MSSKDTKETNVLAQASILMVAGIVTRIIGVLYRSPVTSIIGDEGNGYYSIAVNIYTMILLISSYSIPMAVSKVVSAKMAVHQYKIAHKVFKCALIYVLVIGGIASLITFFGASVLIPSNQPKAIPVLRILAPTIFFSGFLGVFRGYFQGLGTMMPTAVSQIIEQIFVLIASIAGAYVLYHRGEKVGALLHNENYAPSYGAAGASLGPVVGSLIGLIFLLLVYFSYRGRFKAQVKRDTSGTVDSYSTIFRLIVLTILPVLLSTTVYNISNVIDIRIYNSVMIQKGMEDVKAYNWGVYSGKYRVLVNVPIALANAMCSSIVPVLTGLVVREEYRQAKEKISQAMRFTMIVAIPSTIGMSVLARPIITMLFRGEIDLAVSLLHVGSISIIFYTMSTLTNGVLQGINKMKIPVRNACIALVIHIVFLYAALEMDMGIQAVVYANILFAVIVCILNHLAIRKYIRYRQEFIRTFAIPLASSAIMGVVVGLIYWLLSKALSGMGKALSSFLIVMICIVIGAVVYFMAMLFLKGITKDDLMKMPGGRTVYTIAAKCHLM